MARQAELVIRSLSEQGAFEYRPFISASGINSNFKIDLPKALDKSSETTEFFTESIAEELKDVDVIAAAGGAIGLSREVESITGKPRIAVQSAVFKGVKYFRLCDHALSTLKGDPSVGIIEDVSGTLGSVKKVLEQTGLSELTSKVVVGWRRGRAAPYTMSDTEIDEYNGRFAFRELYEHKLNVPVSSVIERFVPLWIPTEKQIANYIPEFRQ